MRHSTTLIAIVVTCTAAALARPATPPDSLRPEALGLGLRGVYFVPNEGQWSDASVAYGFKSRGMDIAFRESALTLHIARSGNDEQSLASSSRGKGSAEDPEPRRGAPPRISATFTSQAPPAPLPIRDSEDSVAAWEQLTLTITFPGSNAVQPQGAQAQSAKFNYYLGDDESRWASNVPSFGEIVYPNLYDGVDLHITGPAARGFAAGGNADGILKYEFHIAPGADYSQIQIAYDGIDSLCVDHAGNLQIAT